MSKIVSDQLITIPYYIDKNTDLGKFNSVIGLPKILSRLKLLSERGVILSSEGKIFVYPTISSKYLISELYMVTRFAY